LRTIRKETAGWYGEESFWFDVSRTIPALVGHPAVFHAGRRSQQLELVSYPVELLVTEQSGGYRIALSHGGTDPAVFLEAETPGRYRVIEFSQKLLAVQEILGANGLSVPAARARSGGRDGAGRTTRRCRYAPKSLRWSSRASRGSPLRWCSWCRMKRGCA